MNHFLTRRHFLHTLAAGSFLSLAPRRTVAAQAEVKVQTFVFKTVDDLKIKADVHRPDDDKLRPVAVWIHGGALINGHRAGMHGPLTKRLLDAGYAVVSIDYRLAPETRLPAIIADVEDAFTWIRKHGPTLFHGDVRKLAVFGGSAGGYLTLMTGFRVRPRPDVLVSLWGYGDLVGDWYSQPSPHKRHHTVKLDRAEAMKQVSGPPVSDSRDRQGDGGAFYQHCRQHGIWPQEVSGWDPQTEADKFFPYMPVKNVTSDYPPTMLIHGSEDTDVPFEQSELMAQQFRRHKVVHEFVRIEGGEHGLGGGDPEKIEAAYDAALAFIEGHMRGK